MPRGLGGVQAPYIYLHPPPLSRASHEGSTDTEPAGRSLQRPCTPPCPVGWPSGYLGPCLGQTAGHWGSACRDPSQPRGWEAHGTAPLLLPGAEGETDPVLGSPTALCLPCRWVQVACPRLSIDWGEAFSKPLLTPYEVRRLSCPWPWLLCQARGTPQLCCPGQMRRRRRPGCGRGSAERAQRARASPHCAGPSRRPVFGKGLREHWGTSRSCRRRVLPCTPEVTSLRPLVTTSCKVPARPPAPTRAEQTFSWCHCYIARAVGGSYLQLAS